MANLSPYAAAQMFNWLTGGRAVVCCRPTSARRCASLAPISRGSKAMLRTDVGHPPRSEKCHSLTAVESEIRSLKKGGSR